MLAFEGSPNARALAATTEATAGQTAMARLTLRVFPASSRRSISAAPRRRASAPSRSPLPRLFRSVRKVLASASTKSKVAAESAPSTSTIWRSVKPSTGPPTPGA